MSDVSLSAALRAGLLAAQQTSALADQTRERLATGRAVTRVFDDPAAFFQAASLTNRAGDLLAVKQGIDLGAQALGGAIAGLSAIEDIAGQLKGLALAARGADAGTRAALAGQFDALRGQLGALADDVSFGGISLIAAAPDDLSVPLNETGSAELTVSGAASDAAALGIGTAAGAFNGFASDADVDAAVAAIDGGIRQLRSSAAGLGSNAAVLNIREDFTQNLVDTLETGAGVLVNADLDAEAARALALRTRDALGTLGLSIAADSERAVLQIL